MLNLLDIWGLFLKIRKYFVVKKEKKFNHLFKVIWHMLYECQRGVEHKFKKCPNKES